MHTLLFKYIFETQNQQTCDIFTALFYYIVLSQGIAD